MALSKAPTAEEIAANDRANSGPADRHGPEGRVEHVNMNIREDHPDVSAEALGGRGERDLSGEAARAHARQRYEMPSPKEMSGTGQHYQPQDRKR